MQGESSKDKSCVSAPCEFNRQPGGDAERATGGSGLEVLAKVCARENMRESSAYP